MAEELSLSSMLEILSHTILMIALSFSLAAAIIFQTDPEISEALVLTAGVLVLLSSFTHRLSNH